MNDEIKNNLIFTYNKYARDRYQASQAGWKLGEREEFYRLLKSEKCRLMLDLGSGPACDSIYFRDRGFDLICVDISREMIRICRENGLDSAAMDIDNLGFLDNSFDAVWSMNCLLHIPKNRFDGVLSDIKQILKPGGLFYLGMYGGRDFEGIWENDFYTPHRFFSFYTDEKLQQIVSRYFDIIYFKNIPLDYRETNFQSVMLRKTKKGGE